MTNTVSLAKNVSDYRSPADKAPTMATWQRAFASFGEAPRFSQVTVRGEASYVALVLANVLNDVARYGDIVTNVKVTHDPLTR